MDGGSSVDSPGRTRALTAASFLSVVDAPGTVVILVHGPHCPPCLAFAPVFERVAQANPQVTFARVDAQAEPELAEALNIQAVPWLLIFSDGILLLSRGGALPLGTFQGLLAKVKSLDHAEVRARAS